MIDPNQQIEWPPGSAAELAKKPDMRMQRCVLDGYFECAAKCPEACLCGQMPAAVYVQRMEAKYGKSKP